MKKRQIRSALIQYKISLFFLNLGIDIRDVFCTNHGLCLHFKQGFGTLFFREYADKLGIYYNKGCPCLYPPGFLPQRIYLLQEMLKSMTHECNHTNI